MVVLPEKYPGVLAAVAYRIDEVLTRFGFPPEAAATIAFDVAEEVRQAVGGSPSYVPKGRDFKNLLRNQELWEKFNGTNYDKLSRDSGLCEMRIRQIIEEMRARDKASRQGQLNLEGGDDGK